MGRLSDFGHKTPEWMHLYNEKYQIRAIHRLNELLRRTGMSQKDLAEATNWSEGFVSRILSGQQNITLKTLARLEAAIGKDALRVTSDTERPHAENSIGAFTMTMTTSEPHLELSWRHGKRNYEASVVKFASEPDGDFVELSDLCTSQQ